MFNHLIHFHPLSISDKLGSKIYCRHIVYELPACSKNIFTFEA